MKFSDIEKQKQRSPTQPPEAPTGDASPSNKATPSQPSARPISDPLNVPSAEALRAQTEIARKVYGQAIQTMQWIIDTIGEKPVQAYNALSLVVQAIIKLIKSDNQAIVALITSSTAKNYLYAHTVNTAILGVLTGNGFGWQEEELKSLGIGALLLDLGMVQYMSLATQARQLSPPEKEQVRLHPVESQKLLERIEDLEPNLRKWFSDLIEHESAWKRGSAGASPSGKSADIPAMARVLGLCDSYEALTHPRVWRKGLTPHDMIKNLLRQRRPELDPPLVKNFVLHLSLFPPGSFVQLSTQESGYVVLVNPTTPTRPTIELRVKANGEMTSPIRLNNLADNPTTHIVAAVEESQAGIKDPNALKELEASHWWPE
jgi:HD-GYP domain-containing protein (c-di-GMP phosphodiesterase class II)